MNYSESDNNQIKIIAFHLPQYHTFPENDEWWGKGFTEWVNVRKAKPLFEGHNQPRVPLNNDYYNMLDISTLERQAEQSKKYGIYGFCYYHYWFNGKKLLEKPVELLLEHNEINQRFCLCWANEPWTRSWDGDTGVVLMPQEYGGKDEWEEHFEYLLPFFRDERYIRVDNKPLFVIYRTNSIECCNEMLAYFHKRALEEGLNGLFILEEKNSFQPERKSVLTQGAIEFEPLYTLKYGRNIWQKVTQRIWSDCLNKIDKTTMRYYDYKKTWKNLAKRAYKTDSDIYQCAFVDWDNTARRGENGIVFRKSSPEVFEQGFKSLVTAAKKKDKKLVFVNAWNEWAEGCYLEPDEKNEFRYLEALQNALDKEGARCSQDI